MFITPGSRARQLRRRAQRGPATYNLRVDLQGVGILRNPFALSIDLDLPLIGDGDIATVVSLIRGTNYTNVGGQGDRQTLVDVFYNKALNAGGLLFQDLVNLVDGALNNTSSDAIQWATGTDEARILFDFRPTGYYQVVDEIKLLQSTTATHGDWVVDAWDGDSWVELKPSFVLGGATQQTIAFDNSLGKLIYRMRQIGGTRSAVPWIQEFQFKVARGDPIPVQPTNYSNVGATGNRNSLITITTNIALNSGVMTNVIDGIQTSGGCIWTGSQANRFITFDFSNIGAVLIDEMRFRQGNTSTHGFWIFQGSNDNVDFTDLGNWLELNGILFGDPKTFNQMRGNRKKYIYYRLLQVSGVTSASPSVYEFEFKISGATKVVTPDFSFVGRGTIDAAFGGSAASTTTWKTGDRRSLIAVTTSPTDLVNQALISGGVIPTDANFLVAGGTPNLLLKNGQSACWIRFEFDNPTVVDGFKWYQQYASAASNDHGTWKLQGSTDNAAWIDIGSTFTLGGTPSNVLQILRTNTTAYKWYRLLQTAGTTKAYNNTTNYAALYVRRIEFKDNT